MLGSTQELLIPVDMMVTYLVVSVASLPPNNPTVALVKVIIYFSMAGSTQKQLISVDMSIII